MERGSDGCRWRGNADLTDFLSAIIRVAKHQWHPRSIFVAKHQWPPRSIFVKEAIITPDSGTLIKRVAGANADWTRIFGGVD